jgi:AraC-like DNA-binding protein
VSNALNDNLFRKIELSLRELVNPINLFSGAKLDEALVVDNVLLFKRTSTEMMRPHGVTHNYHHRFELVVPLSKAGRIHVDGHDYMLGRGRAHLIFPHQFHHYLDIEMGELSWLFITFECKHAGKLAPLRGSPRAMEGGTLEILTGLIKNYLSVAPGPERNFELVFEVSRLLHCLLESREVNCEVVPGGMAGQETHGEILRAINDYVRANLGKNLTIADLAEHTGYSISYLRAIFRREIGVSLGSYMRDSRMSTAAAMLSDPDHGSVKKIAKACGFGSLFAFSRAFKTAMGVPPTAYHKLVRTGKIATPAKPAPTSRKRRARSA